MQILQQNKTFKFFSDLCMRSTNYWGAVFLPALASSKKARPLGAIFRGFYRLPIFSLLAQAPKH